MIHDEYIEYHTKNALGWEIDTHLDAAVWYADSRKLDLEQRYWLAFLTAICETTPTSIYLFSHFPAVGKTRPDSLKKFCETHKGAMAFQYDVRWILYDIESVFSSYKTLISGKTQEEAIANLLRGDTPAQRYESLLRGFKVHKFGKYVMMLYTELLHYLCGVDIEAEIDPRDNHSVRSGLIYASGLEDTIKCVKKGATPTELEAELLRIELREIVQEVKKLNIHERHKTIWAIETTLCTFNKTKHGRRYLGFYKERQRKEIARLKAYTESTGEAFDWKPLIEYHNNWGNWNNKYQ